MRQVAIFCALLLCIGTLAHAIPVVPGGGGSHSAATLAAGVDALTLVGQEFDVDADIETLAAPTAWRVFYSNGSSAITELALGASGTYLKSAGASAAPTWDTPAAGHDAVTIAAGIGAITISTQELSAHANVEALADYTDPNADRFWGWDDSAGAFTGFTLGTGLTTTDTTINLSSGLQSISALTGSEGAIVYTSADDTYTVLTKGTAGQVLVMNGGATAPSWTSTLTGTFGGFTATYVVYPDGSGNLTGESAFTYTATSNTLGVDAIQLGATGVTISQDDDGQLKLLGASGGYDKSLTINLDDTENTVVLGTDSGVTRISAGTLQVATTGYLLGGVKTVGKGTDYTIGTDDATEAYGGFFFNTGASTRTFTLPSAVAGMSVCIKNTQGVAQILRLDAGAGDYIVKSNGSRTSAAAEYYGSTADAGALLCVVAYDATDWYVTAERGTWAEE